MFENVSSSLLHNVVFFLYSVFTIFVLLQFVPTFSLDLKDSVLNAQTSLKEHCKLTSFSVFNWKYCAYLDSLTEYRQRFQVEELI